MLVTLKEVLQDAQAKKYGVGLFNTINMEMARGVIEAAEELRSPVIIGTAESLLKYAPLEELAYILAPMAKRARVPVVLHFDHGVSEQGIMDALKAGFSSVMYDCSTLPFDENVHRVRNIVKYVHMLGATVEGELGHVGSNTAGGSSEELYTSPKDARDYAERTGVDALAVAIGTAHGAYKEPPKLDFGRLKEIRSAVDVPLVLHGGSGLKDEDLKKCIETGICKINIFTDINVEAAKTAADYYESGKGMSRVAPHIVDAVREVAKKKMLIFGSQNRA